MVKISINLYEKLKEMTKKYYLSFYPMKIPLDLENLINKDLLIEKPKEEVLN